MRRIHFYSTLIVMLAAGCCFTACKKDESTEGKKLNLVIGSFAPESTQKLFLDENNLPRWDAGDTLLLAEGNATASPAIVHYAEAGTRAEVTVQDASKTDFYAVYPASGSSVTSAGGSVVVPEVQYYRENASHQQVISTPMAACLHGGGEGGSMFFRNLGSVIKVVVSNYNLDINMMVYAITVTAHEEENYLSGTLNFTFPEGISTSTTQDVVTCALDADKARSKQVTLFCGVDGIEIDRGASKEFYVVVNAFSKTDKLSFTVNGSSEFSYAKFMLNQNQGRTLARNKMGTQPFASTFDDGVPYGIFTTSPTTKVEFAPGNLQFRASDSAWRFAPQQYSIVEWDPTYQAGNSCSRANNRYTQSNWIDLLRWGGTCCKERNMPCLTNDETTPPTSFKGPETYVTNISGTKYDYGYQCKIYNPRSGNYNQPGTWRMPIGKTTAVLEGEYYYLANLRSTTTNLGVENARYAFAALGEGDDRVYGVIFFPDTYTHPTVVPKPNKINTVPDKFVDYNEYAYAQWKLMEIAGCVFLPSCGHTTASGSTPSLLEPNGGYYYTATVPSSTGTYELQFKFSWSWNASGTRNFKSVRLVRTVSVN